MRYTDVMIYLFRDIVQPGFRQLPKKKKSTYYENVKIRSNFGEAHIYGMHMAQYPSMLF
jgi:hypothetical protein